MPNRYSTELVENTIKDFNFSCWDMGEEILKLNDQITEMEEALEKGVIADLEKELNELNNL